MDRARTPAIAARATAVLLTLAVVAAAPAGTAHARERCPDGPQVLPWYTDYGGAGMTELWWSIQHARYEAEGREDTAGERRQ